MITVFQKNNLVINSYGEDFALDVGVEGNVR